MALSLTMFRFNDRRWKLEMVRGDFPNSSQRFLAPFALASPGPAVPEANGHILPTQRRTQTEGTVLISMYEIMWGLYIFGRISFTETHKSPLKMLGTFMLLLWSPF